MLDYVSIQSAEEKSQYFLLYCCVGTAESWPQPLIEHLGKVPGQPWEHLS